MVTSSGPLEGNATPDPGDRTDAFAAPGWLSEVAGTVPAMATFAFIHGAGGRGSDWQLAADELHARGHDTVLIDLPCDQPVGLGAYADAVVDAVGDPPDDLVLVAHSLGGLTAPVAASRLPVQALVFVTAMVPLPGETGGDWWSNSGHHAAFEAQGLTDESEEAVYLHDVPADVLAAAEPPRDQTGEVMEDPCPLTEWPEVPTTYLVCGDDRFFPAGWMTDVVRARLGIEPVVVPGGHCPYLATPVSTAVAIEQAWLGRAALPPVTWGSAPA